MTPGEVKFATHQFGEPLGWDATKDVTCDTLHVRKRGNMFESAWYPTAEELRRLVTGAPVILTVWGGQPPVALNVNEGEL